MNNSEQKNASPSDKGGDGVHIIRHAAGGSHSAMLYKIFALILVGCFAAYVVTMAVDRTSSRSDKTNTDADQAKSDLSDASDIALSSSSSKSTSTSASLQGGSIMARSVNAQNDRNDLSNYVAPGQAPKMEEVIARLHAAGVHEGLGAFNPPGTSPPMVGLAVPDDYVLPEGYVRHFQATDDGQRIEPILMFSPDFDFFDSAGQPIAIPESRVVPGNMAPPGLAIRPIKIPEPLEPGGP